MRTEFPIAGESVDGAPSPFLFVLMGASNLARGYSALANCLTRCLSPHPVEILHAMGPGRGYCAEGGLFNVVYPAIGAGGVLNAARERAPMARRVVALITDIGNDVMYGVPAAEIIFHLDSLMRNLNAIGADVFVSPIPLAVEEDVSEFQFRVLRAVFFPRSPVEYSGAADAVRRINGFLRESAGGRIHLLPSAKDFLGMDKIHYSMFQSHKAWSGAVAEILRALPVEKTGKVSLLSAWAALFANMGRLFYCDMFPVRKKIPGTF